MRKFQSPFKRIVVAFSNLTLNAKGCIVVAIPVMSLMAAMTVFHLFEQQTRRAEASVQHTYQVRSEIRQVLTLLLDAENGIRGYLLSRNDSFLEPYWATRNRLPLSLRALHQLVDDNPSQQRRLSRVEALSGLVLHSMDWRHEFAASNQAGIDVAQLETDKADMDDLRRELAAMQDEEQRLLSEHSAQELLAQRRLEAGLFAGGLWGLAGGILAALLFTARIVRRVHQLEENARRVAEGLPILAQVNGGDEISRLGRTLKETSELLARQRDELRCAHQELEVRVEQRTAELRSTDAELHKANEVRQAVIHSSPLAIWAMDLEGKVTFWNPAAERIFGWSEAEAINRPLPPGIPEGQQDEFRDWLERFKRGEALIGVERTRQKKDGRRIDVSIWTAPLRDAAGKINGTIVIDSDVTDRKSLEEQFRQSQKLEAVGRLAGGVAHDFNNLLTVISGYTEMVLNGTRHSPGLTEHAQHIQYAANRAGALTAQLLAFSRRQISQPRVVDLNEIVSHSTKLLRRVIGEDIEISLRLSPGIGRVKADPIHMDQLIMNLVVNARDAMSRGGKLTIETADVKLDERFVGRHIGVQPGFYCMLAISDTGVGMDRETQTRLFEPFFTTKEPGKGTGLGLSIVYGIVKQNGGDITVESEAGKGTSFKIYLPIVEARAEASTAASPVTEARGTETILLCEDETIVRQLVQAMLTEFGYRVLAAESAAQAMQIAENHKEPIHLLLTDVVMPSTNGFDLAQMLKARRPQLKVLYMSGYTDNRVSGSWVLDPGTAFLQKPFTASSLHQKVREVLRTTSQLPLGALTA